ncbi:MAG TPA: secretion system protein, partial [Micromonosporaceae bacterium]
MILTWELPLAVVGGAVGGAGLFVFVRELLPATPSLGPTLARMRAGTESGARSSLTVALGPWGWLAKYVTPPAQELAILGKGTDAYLTSIAVSGIIGLLAPTVFVFLLSLLGLSLHIVISVLLGPIFAVLFAFLAHRSVVTKGKLARREFSRTFCTYLDLVILELTAAGPVQSLERAAKICHGWVFERIDGALTQAQLQMVFPWDQLRMLGEDIGILELQDFAAIMRSAGDSGAHVQST